MLKALIAVTCVVIIATAGYWVWGDQQAKAAMAQAAVARAQAQATDVAISKCREMASAYDPTYLQPLKSCVMGGLLSLDDFNQATHRPVGQPISG